VAKRIVFHLASLRGGGAERVFVLMANEMAARGHDVTLLAWNAGGPNAALLAEKVRLIDLVLPLRGEGYGKPTTLRGLLQTARPAAAPRSRCRLQRAGIRQSPRRSCAGRRAKPGALLPDVPRRDIAGCRAPRGEDRGLAVASCRDTGDEGRRSLRRRRPRT